MELLKNRREWIKAFLVGGCALGAKPWLRSQTGLDNQRESVGNPIVQTEFGRVRGVHVRRVASFKGIPYAAPPIGKNRFKPPGRAASWNGVRNAFVFGPLAAQPDYPDISLLAGLVEPPPRHFAEDCLKLNIWTPGPGRAKLPVMVWLHGGGFLGWSAGAPCYDGSNLAREQDLVIVSLNHRLNIFGYLYLPSLGFDDYADACNVGMLDIVAALRWVRNNIASFGGDPNNITLFGQSGGGSKIATLMAMPSAFGLFHKAIIQSGPMLRAVAQGTANLAAYNALKQLGGAARDGDCFQKAPMERLVSVFEWMQNNMGTDPMWGKCFNKFELGPVVDERTLIDVPFGALAMRSCPRIPLLIGTNRDEARLFLSAGSVPTEEELIKKAAYYMGVDDAAAKVVVSSYRKANSALSAEDLLYVIMSDFVMRVPSTIMAERAVDSGHQVYMYRFEKAASTFGGKYGAMHTAELPYVFDNLAATPGLVADPRDPGAVRLAKEVSSAWAAFARTGVPADEGWPRWIPYSRAERATMMIGDRSAVKMDPGAQERRAMEKVVGAIT